MPSTPLGRRLARAGHKVVTTPPLLVVFLMAASLVGLVLIGAFVKPADTDLLGWIVGSGVTGYFIAALVVPVFVGIGLIIWTQVRRSRALRRLAQERGWRYTERSQTTLPPYPIPAHTTFATGLVEGLLSGYRVRLYEYHWINGHGRQRRQRTIGVGSVRLPAVLPRLEVVPEGATETVSARMTGLDVDVGNAEFNGRYRVRLDVSNGNETDARKYAVDVLNPRAVEALLATPAFAWYIDGRRMIGTWPVTGNTDALMARLEAMVGIARHLPSFRLDRDR